MSLISYIYIFQIYILHQSVTFPIYILKILARIESYKSSVRWPYLSLSSLYKVCDYLEFAVNNDIITEKSISRAKFRHIYYVKHLSVS